MASMDLPERVAVQEASPGRSFRRLVFSACQDPPSYKRSKRKRKMRRVSLGAHSASANKSFSCCIYLTSAVGMRVCCLRCLFRQFWLCANFISTTDLRMSCLQYNQIKW
mmetsp:Transcript_77180/g.146875  ORF Transcript_77180/g.146875 Transcript_77180/m.146875 type:complete len:109 (+) Transcript_77180:1631-1957(+)